MKIFKTRPNLDHYYKTSDGQAFFNESDAKMHAKTLKNKKVDKVVRPSSVSDKGEEKVKELKSVQPKANKPEASEDAEYAELVEKYTELYGKKPPKSIKLETLQARILEAELKDIDVEDEEDSDLEFDLEDEEADQADEVDVEEETENTEDDEASN